MSEVWKPVVRRRKFFPDRLSSVTQARAELKRICRNNCKPGVEITTVRVEDQIEVRLNGKCVAIYRKVPKTDDELVIEFLAAHDCRVRTGKRGMSRRAMKRAVYGNPMEIEVPINTPVKTLYDHNGKVYYKEV